MSNKGNDKEENTKLIDVSRLIQELEKINIDPATINTVEQLLTKTINTIEWYWKGKGVKRWWATCLRFISLLIAGAGAALPIIDSIEICCIRDGLGFKYSVLFFVIAGAINLFDRFFGLSSGWMRYTLTAMKMEEMLQAFSIDIAEIIHKETPDRGGLILEKSKELSKDTYSALIDETAEWASEFKKSIADIEKLIKSKSK